MRASNLRNKHLIETLAVSLNGDRANVETNAMINGENVELALGYAVHNRFYDHVKKRAAIVLCFFHSIGPAHHRGNGDFPATDISDLSDFMGTSSTFVCPSWCH